MHKSIENQMNTNTKFIKICFLVSLAINVILVFNMNSLKYNSFEKTSTSLQSNLKQDHNQLKNSGIFSTRDFLSYECKDRRRIGGDIYKPTNNKLLRYEGAWFVCFDGKLAPKSNDCNILSFGINNDPSFDYEINKDYGCSVHSFDPYIEADLFIGIRNSKPELRNSFIIEVNSKWKFYSLGISGLKSNITNKNKIGGIDTLENLIERINLKNEIIDVFKLDVEGAELQVLANFDIDYACKYFKQFVLETHAPDSKTDIIYNLLRRLEKCFRLFHRDTRFIAPRFYGEVFLHRNFTIDIQYFINEINLSKFLFSIGELYFINENFI